MLKFTAILLLTVSGSTLALADHTDPSDFGREPARPQFMAPEIDPSSAISALTLLLGGVTVLRARAKK